MGRWGDGKMERWGDSLQQVFSFVPLSFPASPRPLPMPYAPLTFNHKRRWEEILTVASILGLLVHSSG